MLNIFKNSYIDSKFIKSRMNRDNFWNLVFAFLMSFGMMLGKYSVILFPVCTTIFVPLLIKTMQNNPSIKKTMPKYTILVILFSSALITLMIYTKYLTFFGAIPILYFIPTIYFSFNNYSINLFLNTPRRLLDKPISSITPRDIIHVQSCIILMIVAPAFLYIFALIQSVFVMSPLW